MDVTSYERVVAAAVAETTSKFKLAEALALDIPPRRTGPSEDEPIAAYLDAARDAIIAAGGEPRSLVTLKHYRETALWVRTGNGSNFSWVPGSSFTAHNEARAAGISYEAFAANPMKTDEIRRSIGKAGTDGQPRHIARSWSADDRVEVVREALADPAIAAEVVSDRRTRWDVQKAARQYTDEVEARRETGRTEAIVNSKTHLTTMVAGEIARAREALTAARSYLREANENSALDGEVREYVAARLPAVTDLVADIMILVGAADWDAALRGETS